MPSARPPSSTRFAERRPDVALIVRSSVAPWLFARSLQRGRPPRARRGRHRRHPARQPRRRHPGDARRGAGVLRRRRARWIAQEASFLAREGARLDRLGHPAAAHHRGAPGRRPGHRDFQLHLGLDLRGLRGAAAGARPRRVARGALRGRRRGMAPADARRLRQLRHAARSAARRPRRPAAAGGGARRPRPAARHAAGADVARRLWRPRHRPACGRRLAARRRRRGRHVLRRVHAGRRRPSGRRGGDVRPGDPLRGPGGGGRRRRQQAGLRHHLGVRRQRHGAALHRPRPVL